MRAPIPESSQTRLRSLRRRRFVRRAVGHGAWAVTALATLTCVADLLLSRP